MAGGTGVLGRYIVESARTVGHEVVALSRRTGIDVTAGSGLEQALGGVEVIVDAAGPATQSRRKATAFFEAATRNLQEYGRRAGVARLVTVSIVGIDRVPGNPYYAAKLAQEAAARRGPLPATIVRITQFHEFPAQVIQRVRLGALAPMPRWKVQPVAARTAGRQVAGIATEPAAEGSLIEVAGPEVHDLYQLGRAVVRRRRLGVRLVPLPIPGRTGRDMREGALTVELNTPPLGAAGPARIGGPTFFEWLEGPDIKAVGL